MSLLRKVVSGRTALLVARAQIETCKTTLKSEENDDEFIDTESEEECENEEFENDSQSEAESELTEEQVATLKELDFLIDDWSQSPVRSQFVDEASNVTNNPSLCRNLFKDEDSSNQHQDQANISTISTDPTEGIDTELETEKKSLNEAKELLKDINVRDRQLDAIITECPVAIDFQEMAEADEEKFNALIATLLSPEEIQSLENHTEATYADSDDSVPKASGGAKEYSSEKASSFDENSTEIGFQSWNHEESVAEVEKIISNSEDKTEGYELEDQALTTDQESEDLVEEDEPSPHATEEKLSKDATADLIISNSEDKTEGCELEDQALTTDQESEDLVEEDEPSPDATEEKLSKDATADRGKKKKKQKRYIKDRKKHFCIYCYEELGDKKDYLSCLRTNFVRHVTSRHSLKPLVIDYRTASTQRKADISAKLKGQGNLALNKIRLKEGLSLVPARRITINNKVKMANTESYAACSYCSKLYLAKLLYRHEAACASNNSKDTDKWRKQQKKRKSGVKRNGLSFLPTTAAIENEELNGASEMLRTLVHPIMLPGQISLVAQTDVLINMFGSEIIQNHLDHQQLRNVSSRMRDLARLLLKIRELEPKIKSLSDALVPYNFKHILKAAQLMSGYDQQTGKVEVISLAGRLGTSLKICMNLDFCRKIEDAKATDDQKKAAMINLQFMKEIFERRWCFGISSNAEKARKKKETMKKVIMPDNGDIKQLMLYLESQELHFYSELCLEKYSAFEDLNKVLICLIIVLNRRRAGETARIELEYYSKRDTAEVNEEVLAALTDAQQKTARSLSSFQIPGKRTRCVPVVMTKQMELSIDLLVDLREKVGVPKENIFLFGRPFSKSPYDGTKVLREMRLKLDLKNPNDLTSTGLRHNIATMSAINNFDATRTGHLAQSLGHDPSIHKKNYRLPLIETQRGVVGEILVSAAKGNLLGNALEEEITTASPKLDKIDDNTLNEATASGSQSPDTNEPVDSQEISSDSDCDLEKIRNKVLSEARKNLVAAELNGMKRRRTTQKVGNKRKLKIIAPEEIVQEKKSKKRWSTPEKKAVLRQLKDCILENRNPKQARSEECIRKESILAVNNRTWTQVNGLVNNYIKGKLKLPDYFHSL